MQVSLAALVLMVATQMAQTGPPPPPPPQPEFSEVRDANAPRRLVVTYSDGRSVPRLLTTRSRTWGYKFPRQENPPTHEGLPLIALGIDHVVDRDVVVTVSLQYGTPESRIVEVAKVRLTDTQPIRVTELERYGVDPIVFSLDAFPPPLLVQPVVSSASPLLDVTVDLTRNDLPIYRVTFRNRAQRAVMAVSYHTYRGRVLATSGWRKTNRSSPIIEPASDYSFTLAAGSGDTPGFDRFEVSGVLWDDGSVEGEESLKVTEQALGIGFAQQLRRVLVALGDAVQPSGSMAEPASLAQVRAAVAALPIAVDESDPVKDFVAGHVQSKSQIENGQVQVRSAVLRDIDGYIQGHPGAAGASARVWVDEARPRYSAWLKRTGAR